MINVRSGMSKIGPQRPMSCLFFICPCCNTSDSNNEDGSAASSELADLLSIGIRCVAEGSHGKQSGQCHARTAAGHDWVRWTSYFTPLDSICVHIASLFIFHNLNSFNANLIFCKSRVFCLIRHFQSQCFK